MALGNVDYWRTFRDFETNASIIADQAQDVVTFQGGDNVRLSFNEGDDIITWHADLSGVTADVTANLSVVNDVPTSPSMLEYNPATGEFTYHPEMLSNYATISYVDNAIVNGIANVNLTGYATEVWVQGYIGTAVDIPDTDDFVTKTEYNQDYIAINGKLDQISANAVGYTGSAGQDGSSVKIVGSVENYTELTTVPRWKNYLGQVGDGVIIRKGSSEEYPPGSGELVTILDGSLAVAVNLLYPPTNQTLWEPVSPIIGYTGSEGPRGYDGSRGFTGSAIVVGQFDYHQNVVSNLWTINHNLGVQYPVVELIDDSNNSISGTYGYPTINFLDADNLTVAWTQPATGRITISAGSGVKGDQGATGLTGSIGNTGFTGSIGFTGSSGAFAALGFTGSQGAKGDRGFTGSQGDTGFNGSTGFAGSKGDIGFTGSRGIQGFTGSLGNQGIIGFTGSQGIQGIIGFTGSQGIQGITGFDGSRGFKGDRGFGGSQGNDGFTGSQSIVPGPIGFTGSKGFSGSAGFSGSQGDQGLNGFTGSASTVAGPIGFTGSQGDTGSDGSSVEIKGSVANSAALDPAYTGNVGDGFVAIDTGNLWVWDGAQWNDVGQIRGYAGSVGFSGSIGFTGSRGDIGFTGSQGDQGVVGFTGSKGDQGVVGFAGSQGDQGVVGFTGSKGDQGVVGFTGSQGDIGATGFNGSIGIQGNLGFVGSQGNVGFTGSKGDQGVVGFTGSLGDPGNIGFSGSQGLLGPNGPIGFTGSQGIPGEAANVGFTGSTGDQGTIGFSGSQGDQGNVGFTGSASTAVGPQGNIGFTGSKGDQGITGFTGSQGDAGAVGFTGSKGDTGFNGSVGFTGSASTVAGPTGFTGSKGDTGFTGSDGADTSTLASVTSNGATTSNDIFVGGMALAGEVTFSTDLATPGTALDLNLTVHSLADGNYTLADGIEGQMLIITPRTGATRNGVNVTFSKIRSFNNTTDSAAVFTSQALAIFASSNVTIGSCWIYIFADGAWNYMNLYQP